MSGKAVAQHVGSDAFAEAAVLPGFAADGLHGAGRQMKMRAPGGKQPGAGRLQEAVVGAQDLQQARREHGVTILRACRKITFTMENILEALREAAVSSSIPDFDGAAGGSVASSARR